MISIDDVLRIHEILIERFGGASGVREKELLESAIGRPSIHLIQKICIPDQ
jgi:death-on-curing protein